MKAADAPKYYPRGGPTMPRKPQSCNSMKDERHEMEMQTSCTSRRRPLNKCCVLCTRSYTYGPTPNYTGAPGAVRGGVCRGGRGARPGRVWMRLEGTTRLKPKQSVLSSVVQSSYLVCGARASVSVGAPPPIFTLVPLRAWYLNRPRNLKRASPKTSLPELSSTFRSERRRPPTRPARRDAPPTARRRGP